MIDSAYSLAAPVLMFFAAILIGTGPGFRPGWRLRVVELCALLALVSAMAGAGLLWVQGPATELILGTSELGLSVRRDVVSVAMLLLVSFIGWIVLRYSARYLDGEPRQGAFLGWMSATLGAVLLLVQAGDLMLFFAAWLATSLSLHRLLLFYAQRAAAIRSGRKKYIFARLGDLALGAAFMLLWVDFGTSNINGILELATQRASVSHAQVWAASMLAFAAILKSAQFPSHGWLIEVVETPTPVSALLHAGVVNGGGFLLIRFADVMVGVPGVLAVLVVVGGFSALLGALAMLAQPAVKNSLAWSTVAQMGFMIMQCGLGLFALALLHIVAHSLYKAHAFLVSGMAVDTVAANRRPGPVAVPDLRAVLKAFILAQLIYVLVAFGFGIDGKSTQALVLGAVLVFGVAYLLAQGLAETAPGVITRRTILYSMAVSISYFTLQTLAELATTGVLPTPASPGPLQWALMLLVVLSFGLVAFAQALFPLWAYHPAAAGLRIHLANGLYANAIIDRMLGNWRLRKPSSGVVQHGEKRS